MRLDHLLSRESSEDGNIQAYIPRSIRTGAIRIVTKKLQRSKTERQRTFEKESLKSTDAFHSVSSSGLAELEEQRTLTTAQQEMIQKKASCKDYRSSINKAMLVSGSRRKNQATKSTGWMPWHHTPKKDVASCDKLRGAASRHRSVDIRMGEPGR